MRLIHLALLLAALISSASAASWTGGVDNVTDGSSWWIHRQSANLSFDLSSSVEGEIAPIIGPGGRVLSSFHAHYTDIDVNDVRLKERTSALEGVYSSEDEIKLRANATSSLNIVNMTETKPAGSDVWTITFEENWPVALNASRTIDYVGTGLNDQDCIGNNLDSVGTMFLYNKEFSKERVAGLKLDRMNATVIATDNTIIRADVMPTRSTDYGLESHSTGIADLRYRQTYPNETVQNIGLERYYGTYDIKRNIEMRSVYTELENEADWLSCCLEGCLDIDPVNSGGWVESEVFDCICG